MVPETPAERSDAPAPDTRPKPTGTHVTGRRDRLDKVLVHLAIGSRSEVGRVIKSGVVSVDGRIVRDPEFKFDPTRATVGVNGADRPYREFYHVLLNKPAGTVTSTSDRDGPPVTSILSPELKRPDWMPVGRLDKDTTGLLVLTTDGTLAHRLTHPKWKVDKLYRATLAKPATTFDVTKFARGLRLDEQQLEPAELSWTDDPTHVQIKISEGKYHQVKRMFGVVGNEVKTLQRVAFGGLTLPDDLSVGQARWLTRDEEQLLYSSAGLTQSTRD